MLGKFQVLLKPVDYSNISFATISWWFATILKKKSKSWICLRTFPTPTNKLQVILPTTNVLCCFCIIFFVMLCNTADFVFSHCNNFKNKHFFAVCRYQHTSKCLIYNLLRTLCLLTYVVQERYWGNVNVVIGTSFSNIKRMGNGNSFKLILL